MTDHAEEREMEAEALAAIFDTHFVIQGDTQWTVELVPEHGDDDANHVSVKLIVNLPELYPECVPEVSIEIVKGLAPEHVDLLLDLAKEEAIANEGMPAIFAICERVREWLVEHNRPGLDDRSMHAQMMRKQQEEKVRNRTRGPMMVGVSALQWELSNDFWRVVSMCVFHFSRTQNLLCARRKTCRCFCCSQDPTQTC